ncbi:PaaI family thioesterase [Thalassospiraceae bacterium LMO-JJ14]|nr:PaaI family thioesterase [Thalassospiraceae bacterium LMO-JJ14]
MSTTYPLPHVTIEHMIERAKGYLPEYMGVVPVEISEGKLVSRLDIKPHHTAPNGYLHAATIISLADTTCGYATYAHMPEGGTNFTTIELKSNHLSTARDGAIIATATARHLGGRTHVWDAEVTHEETGKTIALFRCTQMILR